MSSTQVPLPVTPPPPAVRPAPAWGDKKPASSPAPPPRKSRKIWVILAVIAVFALAIYIFAVTVLRPSKESTIQLYTIVPRSFPVILEEKGELKAASSIEIRSELEGKSTIINLVDEGSRVKKGDLLVELASDVIETNLRDEEIKEATAAAAFEASSKEYDILRDENASKIRKADLALELAKLALEKYKEGERVQLEQEARLAVDKARQVLDRASADYKDSKDLFEQGFYTRIELDNDRFKEYEATLELAKVELALKVLKTYTVPMALQEKQSDVVEAQKELERERKSAAASEAKAKADMEGKKSNLDVIRQKVARLRDQKAKSRIVAPADGLVVYSRSDSWWRSDTQIEKGTQVYERQSLIELPDTSSMKVIIRVHETQIEHLKVGLPAVVEVEGYSGQLFSGRVSKIGVLADSQNRWLNPDLKEYETTILLDGTFRDLKPGTTARVRVEIAQLENVLASPVQAVFGKDNHHYVFLDGPEHKVSYQEVELGLASTEYVEIKKGVDKGQVIRLAISDEMKLMIPERKQKGTPGEEGEEDDRRSRRRGGAAPAAGGASSGDADPGAGGAESRGKSNETGGSENKGGGEGRGERRGEGRGSRSSSSKPSAAP